MSAEAALEPLSREFLGRPVLDLAAALLGQLVVRRTTAGLRVGRIVETEAYGPQGVDASSHAFGGPRPRCARMFGPAGRAYVYLAQGNCCCLNTVAERGGVGAAVLIRAAEPLHGVGGMRRARLARLADGPTRRRLLEGFDHELARGPGRLCLCLDVDRRLDGVDLADARSALYLASAEAVPDPCWTARVGMNPSSPSAGWRWRALDPASRAVSLPRGRPQKRPQPLRCPEAPPA